MLTTNRDPAPKVSGGHHRSLMSISGLPTFTATALVPSAREEFEEKNFPSSFGHVDANGAGLAQIPTVDGRNPAPLETMGQKTWMTP